MIIENKIKIIEDLINNEIIEIPKYILKAFKKLKKVSKKHNQYNACLELANEIIWILENE